MAKEIDDRIFRFACRAVDIYGLMVARGGASRELSRQYLRAATSIGANAAEAAAGHTKPEFLSRLGVARRECREAIFWLRLIQAKRLLPADSIAADLDEAIQIAAILRAIVKGKESPKRG